MTDDYRENYDNRDDACGYCLGTRTIDGKICPACDGSGAESGYDDDEYRD